MGPFKGDWDEKDVQAVIDRGDPHELLYVPVEVGMNADCFDRDWAEGVCLELAKHPHFNVRGNAMLGFGHIARVCGDMDLERIAPVITAALRDPEEYVRDHANDAACDIELYLGVTIAGYDGKCAEAAGGGNGA